MWARSSRLLAIVSISLVVVLEARPVRAEEPGGGSATALPVGTPVSAPPAPTVSSAPPAEAAPNQPPAPTASSAPLEVELDEEEPSAPVAPHPAKQHRKRWYGWQTLIGDFASVTFLFATAKSLDGYSLVPYVALSPTIHFAHGNPVQGIVSLGTRVVLPLGGAFTGIALGSASGACDHAGTPEDDGTAELGCVLGTGAIGFLLGIGAAVVIDAAVLAFDEEAKPAPARRATLRVAPTVAYDGRKASIGLAGSF